MKADTKMKLRSITVRAKVYRAATDTWNDLGVVAKRPYSRLGRSLDLLGLGFLKHFLKLAAVLTQAGEEWFVDVLDAVVNNQSGFTQYGGWGTGADTASKDDVALSVEGSEARVATTRSQFAVDKLRHVFQITANAGKTITNAGVLSASTNGTLILFWDHAGQALNQYDAIQYTVDCEIT